MAIYAMVNGNSVSNIIVADDKEATELLLHCTLIETTPENPSGIGWTVGEDGKFIAPLGWTFVDGVWQAPITEQTEEIVYE